MNAFSILVQVTVTVVLPVAVVPMLSVTVQTTVFEPVVLYEWLRLEPVPVLPSPSVQE